MSEVYVCGCFYKPEEGFHCYTQKSTCAIYPLVINSDPWLYLAFFATTYASLSAIIIIVIQRK